MTTPDLNGPPPESGTPSPTQNLRNGLTGSPAAKLKLIVAGVIIVGIVGVAAISSKKDEEVRKTEASKVAIAEITLAEDDPGAKAANPEVDMLISQVESERSKNAITTGDTYVAPAPDLESAPPPPPEKQPETVYVPPTVSYASHQAKMAALQGLDERISGLKSGTPTEVVFQQPRIESASPTQVAAQTGAGVTSGDTGGDQGPVQKEHPAGTVWFATTLAAIDSDVPGPIKARIEQGPYAGGTVLGSYEITGRKYVTMSFSKIVFNRVEIPISAVGLNPNNGVAGIEGDVDNHWGQRLILPTLAAAVGKYAEAATFGGVTSVTAGGSVIQQPELTDKEKLTYAFGSGVQEGVTPVIQEEASAIKRQVSLPQNTSFALMLVDGF